MMILRNQQSPTPFTPKATFPLPSSPSKLPTPHPPLRGGRGKLLWAGNTPYPSLWAGEATWRRGGRGKLPPLPYQESEGNLEGWGKLLTPPPIIIIPPLPSPPQRGRGRGRGRGVAASLGNFPLPRIP